MMKPQRIRRRRTKGWKMPEGAVYVGRPTRFGNPFTVEGYYDAGYGGGTIVAKQHCVDAYRAWLLGKDHWAHNPPMPPPPDIRELRGKDLCCWCGEDEPCHADVLLELCTALDREDNNNAAC